jgi:hypothetical protein
MLIEASTLGEARQRILNKRVFSDVQVEAITNGAIVDLRIVVKERLTLLPVPFVSSSDGQRRGGVFLLDTNLFGRMKTLAAGITLSTLGRSVVGLYQDPSLFSSRWATRVNTLYSDFIQQRRAGPEVVYAFQEIRDELAATLGYKLTRALSLYGGAFYIHVKCSPMLPATLQFLITMIACAINERMQRKLDYTHFGGKTTTAWRLHPFRPLTETLASRGRIASRKHGAGSRGCLCDWARTRSPSFTRPHRHSTFRLLATVPSFGRARTS